MKKNHWKMGAILGVGVLAAQAAWMPAARAQPDPNDAPKATNPPENNRLRFGGGAGGGNRNPEEMQKRMEDAMRQMLGQAGVNDAPTQDTVLAYIKTDMEARRPLREQSTKLFQALRNGGVTDDQLLALITDYRASQQSEKARREKAETDLDAKVHYTKNPRLEAMLLLGGLIGDGGGGGMMMGGMGGGRFGGGGRGGQNANGVGANGVAANPNGQPGQANAADAAGKDAQREAMRQKMLQRFDKNGNGVLDPDEQAAMKAWREQRRQQHQNQGNANGNNPQPPAPGADGNNPPPVAPPVTAPNA